MNNFSINPEYKILNNPFKNTHNVKTTETSIKKILSNGTPRWCSHPEEFKNYAKESFQKTKEDSDDQVAGYRMEDQALLTNKKARMVNIMMSREFVKKLRDNGVKCFTIDNNFRNTVALWAVPQGGNEIQYVTFLQVPCMYEWSVLRLDNHGLPNGEDFRGYRTVISQLVLKNILTEDKVHEIFGKPTEAEVSRRYRKTLYQFRNHLI